MDKLTALKVFRRVAELNGFHAAALDLNYSDAAVSKIIKELEADLGTRLINRTTRRMSLTEAGRIYHSRVSDLLDQLSGIDHDITNLSLNPRGSLKVNAPMSLGQILIAPLLPSFLTQYTDISIDLVMDDSFVDLMAHGFDVSIRGSTGLKDSSLISRKLTDSSLILCAAPGYIKTAAPLQSPEDLARHNCLIYTLTSQPGAWSFTKEDQHKHIMVSGRLNINNSMALCEAAIQGAGIALLPDFICADALKTGRLVRLLPGWQAVNLGVYALYPAHREDSQKLRVFLDFLIKHIPSLGL